jgi:uncharacterized protein
MKLKRNTDEAAVIAATQTWLEMAVIGLNLCPFAKSVHVKKQIRYAVCNSRVDDKLLETLVSELKILDAADPNEIDTTLIIHPRVLTDFLDQNDFMKVANQALKKLGLLGTIQIASFHPQFQFAGTGPDDITNCTNRSPYPTLHLLREASIDYAVASFPDASEIYNRNIETLNRLGPVGWDQLQRSEED